MKDKVLLILFVCDLYLGFLLIAQIFGDYTPKSSIMGFYYNAPYKTLVFFIVFILMTLIRIFFGKGREEENGEARKNDEPNNGPRGRIR